MTEVLILVIIPNSIDGGFVALVLYIHSIFKYDQKGYFICFIKRLLTKSIGITGYMWVYDNYCIYELPWNSAWTWWLCLLGVDLGYYWFHRMAHGLQASSLYFTY